MLFHTTDSPYYGADQRRGLFRTEADVERAGFTRWIVASGAVRTVLSSRTFRRERRGLWPMTRRPQRLRRVRILLHQRTRLEPLQRAGRRRTGGEVWRGSADPQPDGQAPYGFTIKGNADSMLFHTTDSPYYGRTKAEVWFRTEADAERAGFAKWDRRN